MFIRRREKGNNYYRKLQNDSLEMLQHLSGERWTDFNVHDPGLTISDFVNYALYELNYNYEFPFESYLADEDGVVRYERKGIFDETRVLSPSVVTTRDYECLIMNAFEEVAACRVSLSKGYYRITIKPQKALSKENREELKKNVLELYHRNRNLCEMVSEVEIVNELQGHTAKQYEGMPDIGPEKEPVIYPLITKDYRSVQLDFPENYGLGERGISDSSPESYKAMVMQLKAYLLIFDYMLADATGQAGNRKKLFELSSIVPARRVEKVIIPGIEKLIDEEALVVPDKAHRETWIHMQKSRYLDLLDNLYGERTERFFRDQSDGDTKNDKRAHLINKFPELNRDRFKSFDLNDPRSMPVIKKLSATLLGFDAEHETSVVKSLGQHNLRLSSDDEFFAQYSDYQSITSITGAFYTPLFSDKFEVVPQLKMVFRDSDFPLLKSKIILLERDGLFESFLVNGANPQHYRMMHLTETGIFVLLFQYPGKKEWMKMGDFTSRKELIDTANLFWEFIRKLDPQRHMFYLVEHILLGPADSSSEDPQSLSIVIPGFARNTGRQKQQEELLRERLPAHLNVKIYRVKLDYLHSFEGIYFGWREALAMKDESRISYFSQSLRTFLQVSKQFSKDLHE